MKSNEMFVEGYEPASSKLLSSAQKIQSKSDKIANVLAGKPTDPMQCLITHEESKPVNEDCALSRVRLSAGIGNSVEADLKLKDFGLKNGRFEMLSGHSKKISDLKIETLGLSGPCDKHKTKVLYELNNGALPDIGKSLKLSSTDLLKDLIRSFSFKFWDPQPYKYSLKISTCNGKGSIPIWVYPDVETKGEFKIRISNSEFKRQADSNRSGEKNGPGFEVTGEYKEDGKSYKLSSDFLSKNEKINSLIGMPLKIFNFLENELLSANSNIKVKTESAVGFGWNSKMKIVEPGVVGYEAKYSFGASPFIKIECSLSSSLLNLASYLLSPPIKLTMDFILSKVGKKRAEMIQAFVKMNGGCSGGFDFVLPNETFVIRPVSFEIDLEIGASADLKFDIFICATEVKALAAGNTGVKGSLEFLFEQNELKINGLASWKGIVTYAKVQAKGGVAKSKYTYENGVKKVLADSRDIAKFDIKVF